LPWGAEWKLRCDWKSTSSRLSHPHAHRRDFTDTILWSRPPPAGDEFVVLVDFIETKRVEELVRRIENAVENLNASKQRPYRLSLSIGRSIYGQGEGVKASDFLSMLDADMYARKRDKKPRDKEKSESVLESPFLSMP